MVLLNELFVDLREDGIWPFYAWIGVERADALRVLVRRYVSIVDCADDHSRVGAFHRIGVWVRWILCVVVNLIRVDRN